MANDARRALRADAARAPWKPWQAAEFAARRDYRLLQLLSKDPAAEATAGRLGIFGSTRFPESGVTQRVPQEKEAGQQPATRRERPAKAQGKRKGRRKPTERDKRRSAERHAEFVWHRGWERGQQQPQAMETDAGLPAPAPKPVPTTNATAEVPGSPRREQAAMLQAASEALAAKAAAAARSTAPPVPSAPAPAPLAKRALETSAPTGDSAPEGRREQRQAIAPERAPEPDAGTGASTARL